MECTQVGGTTDNLAGPNGHATEISGRQATCTVSRHHKQRQSCKRKTEPQVFLQTAQVDDTGKLPSIH